MKAVWIDGAGRSSRPSPRVRSSHRGGGTSRPAGPTGGLATRELKLINNYLAADGTAINPNSDFGYDPASGEVTSAAWSEQASGWLPL